MKKKSLLILLAVLMAFAVFGCSGSGGGSSERFPMTVKDGAGNDVVLDKEPEKIISLAPNCTEILFAIGAESKLVGISNWCNYPQETADIEKIGDTFSVNVERIIELDADLVIVAGYMAADSVSALQNANIPVYIADFPTVDSIYEQIEMIGKITNKSSNAKDLTKKLKDDLKKLESDVAKFEARTVFIDLGGQYSSSKMDFLGNTLSIIKATNIAYDYDMSSPQLSAETIIEKNPDVYIVMGPQSDFVPFAGFNTLKASVNNEVYYFAYDSIEADMILRQGPRFVEGLRVIAQLVHPEMKKS